MNIDLSKNLEAVAPWKLTLTWEGAEHRTRRPTIGLIGRIQTMGGMKLAEVQELVKDIFVGRVDFSNWAPEALFGALNSYMAYFNRESTKNSEAIAASVDAAMAEPAAPAPAEPAGEERAKVPAT